MMPQRRTHSKINNLPDEIISAINDAIVNKRKTYKEIEEWLRADGYNVSSSGLQRYGSKFLAKLERISQAREQAKTIIQTSSDCKLEMAEATSTVAFQLLMDMLINTENGEVDKNTLKAITTLAGLEKSTVAREKLKIEYDKGVSIAFKKVEQMLKEELKKYPEVLEKILEISNSIKNDLKAQ